jgi:nicotinamidase-related amidase
MPRGDGRALLVVDVFNHFRFPGGDALASALVAVAPRIAAAMVACRRQGYAVVFCNDNFARWHQSFEAIIEFTAKEGLEASGDLLVHLRPQASDIVLLKSRHSAFFQTQLPALLEHLGTRDLAIAGAATDACVLCTAVDAHVRGFEVHVLSDATAAMSEARHDRALTHLRESADIGVVAHTA